MAGAGHRRAAEAVADSLHWRGASVAVCDTMPYTHPLFRAVYVRGGLGLITRMPRLYGMAYRIADRPAIDRALRGPRYQAQQISSRLLLDVIRSFSPDAVVCTHFLPAELCAGWRRSGELTIPLYTVITDFEPHRFWQHPGTDGYCVAQPGAADRLVEAGVDRASIAVTGIPIHRRFSQLPDRAAARHRLHLDLDRPLLLLSGGGLGVGGIDRVAQALLRHPLDAQIAIITGINRTLRHRLRHLSNGWIVRGFVDNMWDWLAATDIAIGKAGGLAASESMAAGTPMIVPYGLTGHETRNANYLAALGVAVLAASGDEAIKQAMCLLDDHNSLYARMQQAALQFARPCAAEAVAEFVLRSAARTGYGLTEAVLSMSRG